jgi:thymidine kinase
VIGGVHYFDTINIVHLIKALIHANRLVIVTGTNLDWKGDPINFMPEIMALGDEYRLTNVPCEIPGCDNIATRSQEINGKWESRCIKHHTFEGRPDHKHLLIDQIGSLTIHVGGMYSSKTTSWRRSMQRLERRKTDFEVFKWIQDKRYTEREKEYLPFQKGVIGFNYGTEEIPAVIIKDANDIMTYLNAKTGTTMDTEIKHRIIKSVFIDEAPWIPEIEKVVKQLIYQGYKVEATGLWRYFNMEPIKIMGTLLAMADKIVVGSSYCTKCGRRGTESQRFDMINGQKNAATYSGDKIKIGGTETNVETIYEARCVDCVELKNKPKPKYKFERYNPTMVDHLFIK